MSQSERDTHFAGAAELLLYNGVKCESLFASDEETLQTISRFLYDFACHILRQTDILTWDAYGKSPIELMTEDDHAIPDLTEWPKSEH